MPLVFSSNLTKPLLLISPGYYGRPKRNQRKWVRYAKAFLGEGVNMVHYGHSENGEWPRLRAGKMKQILRSDLLLEQTT